jgi:hypothetical protein
VKVGGQWLRRDTAGMADDQPGGRYLAGVLTLNPELDPQTRRKMSQIADQRRVDVLEKRVVRLEHALADYAHEQQEAARRVTARLERMRSQIAHRADDARRLLDRRGL